MAKRIAPIRPRRFRKRWGIQLPEGVVYVGRPTRWGNPFRVGQYRNYTARDAVADYISWLNRKLSMRSAENAYGLPPTTREIRKALRGKDLACWCAPGATCHADVLLRIANPRRRNRHTIRPDTNVEDL